MKKVVLASIPIIAFVLMMHGCGGGGGGGGSMVVSAPSNQNFGYLSVKAAYPEGKAAAMRASGTLETTVATIYRIECLTDETSCSTSYAPLKVSHADQDAMPYGESFVKDGLRYVFVGMGIFDHSDGEGLVKCLVGQNLTLVMAMKDASGATQQLGITPGLEVVANETKDDIVVEIYSKDTIPPEALDGLGLDASEIDVVDAMVVPRIVAAVVYLPPVIQNVIPDYTQFADIIIDAVVNYQPPTDPGTDPGSDPVDTTWDQVPILTCSVNGSETTEVVINEGDTFEILCEATSQYPGLGSLLYYEGGSPVMTDPGVSGSSLTTLSDTVLFDNPEPGTYYLEAVLTSYLSDEVTVNHVVTKEVTVVVEEYNGLFGYVTDSETGNPVSGAGVFLIGSDGVGSASTQAIDSNGDTYECSVNGADYATATDASGYYEFMDIPADTYQIYVVRDYIEEVLQSGVVVD